MGVFGGRRELRLKKSGHIERVIGFFDDANLAVKVITCDGEAAVFNFAPKPRIETKVAGKLLGHLFVLVCLMGK